MAITKSLINVVLLGISFMLIFTAFQTWGNVQRTILHSIIEDDPDFHGDAYYSLAIIYVIFALFNWTAPSVISVIGPKFSMLLGAITYMLFIMSFSIATTWLLYFASVILGIGAAMIWTGQGNYLTLNSTSLTISRNSGVFWALLQLSMFIGNIFVYFTFRGKDSVDHGSRTLVIWVLSAIALSGIVLMVFFPKPSREDSASSGEAIVEPHRTPLEALRGAAKLFFTKDMLMLNVTFLYTGFELGFWSGVYSSCIGFTQDLPNRKQLVGLSGIFIGVGEVLGGVTFGILGPKIIKWGRHPIVLLGFVLHVVSFAVIFLNLPNDSPFKDTNSSAIMASSAYLAITCSFLLGLGDACYNTQLYSILGGVYADNSASAFANFKFSQSVSAGASFFYASSLVLYGQLVVLLIFAILGTTTFVWVEISARKRISAEKETST